MVRQADQGREMRVLASVAKVIAMSTPKEYLA
jgi:hypothetical protein